MFCFKVGALLRAMELVAPEILAEAKKCMDKSRLAKGRDFVQLEIDAATFVNVPSISIDYAVMEKCSNIAVVPCDIGWSDIGSWSALGNLVAPDKNGNRIEGETLLHDVKNCYVQSNDRMIAAVGIENLIVVDTPDALLIADKSRAQDVRHVFAELKARGHDTHKVHLTVHRSWGTYTVLEEGPGFKIKRLVVKPGAALSLQMHMHRSEHWIVVNGLAKVTNGDQEMMVAVNESTYIPAGHKHRLQNPGSEELTMIEVQSGKFLGEEDIIRFQDMYGRC